MGENEPMTYDKFCAYMRRRPEGMSPLAWVAELANRPPETSHWLLLWLREPV